MTSSTVQASVIKRFYNPCQIMANFISGEQYFKLALFTILQSPNQNMDTKVYNKNQLITNIKVINPV